MNLREANVMREKIADLSAKLASLEKRIALVEDATQKVVIVEEHKSPMFHVEQGVIKRGPGRPRKDANDR